MPCCLSQCGCYNKNIVDWVALTVNVYFSQFWRRKQSQTQALVNSVSGKGPLPGSYTTVSSLCPYMKEGVREFFGVAGKGNNSFHKSSTLLTKLHPKSPLPNAITPKIRFEHRIFGVNTTFQYIALANFISLIRLFYYSATDLYSMQNLYWTDTDFTTSTFL